MESSARHYTAVDRGQAVVSIAWRRIQQVVVQLQHHVVVVAVPYCWLRKAAQQAAI